MDTVRATEQFMKDAFVQRPHHSFNDWRIMYEHSRSVLKYALQIAAGQDCDEEVVGICALLHDIGKTYDADEDYLHTHHDSLGYAVSKDFLETIGLEPSQRQTVESFLKGEHVGIVSHIVDDADIVAFFSDPVLQDHVKEWALRTGRKGLLKRKFMNKDRLNLEVSRGLIAPYVHAMQDRYL